MKTTRFRARPTVLAASLLIASQAYAAGTGTIADGVGNISQNGRTTTVNQSSDKLVVNWNNMNVGMSETLTFNQPGANSAVLNRINSPDATSILGALNANGRVFIVNPNGVLIGNTASVNVGSLVASSLNISDADFKAGRLQFSGGGQGAVVNNGTIHATESVGLIGAGKVENTGRIQSDAGNVVLAAGDDVTLAFSDARLQATLNKASLEALVNNGGLISTANGDIVLTAWARDSITRGVINNTGVLEASSLRPASPSQVVAASLGGGAVTMGGEVSAKAVQISGNAVSLDGTVNASNLTLTARQRATTTDRAVLGTFVTYLYGGDFDLMRGDIRTPYLIMRDVQSANIALAGLGENYSAYGVTNVSGSVKGNLGLRSNQGLFLNGASVGGNLDVATKADASLTNGSRIGGNATLSGNRVDILGTASQVTIDGDLSVTAGNSATLKALTANNVKITVDKAGANGGGLTMEGIVSRGSVDLLSAGLMSLGGMYGGIQADGRFTVTGAETVNVWSNPYDPSAEALHAKDISIHTDGNIIMRGSVAAKNDITLDAACRTELYNPSTLTSGRNMVIKGDVLTMLNGKVTAGGSVDVNSYGNVSISNLVAGGGVNVAGSGRDVLVENLTAGGPIHLEARAGLLTVRSLKGQQSAYLKGVNGITLLDRLSTKDLVLETVYGDISTAGLDVDGDLTYKFDSTYLTELKDWGIPNNVMGKTITLRQ
ncbi:two-partner secretion domain-containing protein [Ralstonia sp. 24A2]|uniref:two-partner secretion domain-containing protein n=1 Tax=Ralstonia sp. 24A2 TaxID=3447364 RepID=UPI003F69A134